MTKGILCDSLHSRNAAEFTVVSRGIRLRAISPFLLAEAELEMISCYEGVSLSVAFGWTLDTGVAC